MIVSAHNSSNRATTISLSPPPPPTFDHPQPDCVTNIVSSPADEMHFSPSPETASKDHQYSKDANSVHDSRIIPEPVGQPFPKRRRIEPSFGFYSPKETRDLQKSFQIHKHIGEGAFVSIFLACDKKEQGAARQGLILKRVKTSDDSTVPVYGFPKTALREIRILRMADHENVIQLYEVVTTNDAITGAPEHVFLVLEYMEYDLAALLGMPDLSTRLTFNHVKSWTLQLLNACQFLHNQDILHRDLKPSNILVNHKGTLKVADFGLARLQCQDRRYTTSIGTASYRAPEVLLGCTNYDVKVDMWSTGCILFELGCRNLENRPLFHAETPLELCQQIDRTCSLMASPGWLSNVMANARHCKVEKDDIQLAGLVSSLLHLHPSARASAEDALGCAYLSDPPLFTHLLNLPRSSCHRLDVIKSKHIQCFQKNK